MNELEKVLVEQDDADRVVIWLHGLGASGHDFEGVVPSLGVHRTRFVFPHAPVQPVTLNGGMMMRSWYDIVSLSGPERENLDDVACSARQIESLISRELEMGMAAERIVLAGFSQGGALALHVGLRYPVRLRGIMVLSAYLLDPEGIAEASHPASVSTPIFFAHGRHDSVVPFAGGSASYRAVRALSPERDIEWHEYAMAHEVCPEEIKDIGCWLRQLP